MLRVTLKDGRRRRREKMYQALQGIELIFRYRKKDLGQLLLYLLLKRQLGILQLWKRHISHR